METACWATASQVVQSASLVTPFAVQEPALALLDMAVGLSCPLPAVNANGCWMKPAQVEVATAFRVGQIVQVATLMERTSQEASQGTVFCAVEAAQATALLETVCHDALCMLVAIASQGIACQVVKAALPELLSHASCETSMNLDPETHHLGKSAVQLVAAAQVAGVVPQEQPQQAAN